jgi:hypothetical protein
MAEYNNIITPEGITRVEITGEELTKLEADRKAFADKSADRKLIQIKEIRLEKLKETDWWVISEQITDAQKTWRQNLRNLPQDYSADKYDELLARDEQGKLTHSIWEKP